MDGINVELSLIIYCSIILLVSCTINSFDRKVPRDGALMKKRNVYIINAYHNFPCITWYVSPSFIDINHTHNDVDGQLYFSLQFWGD